MKIAIGSDKSGFAAKEAVKAYLVEAGVEFDDLGTTDLGDVHPYYQVASEVAPLVQNGTYEKAVLICGTGAGMSVVSNKYKGVYAVACEGVYSAKMARAINNANVLCMGGWIVGPEMAVEMVKTFLTTAWCQDLEDWRAVNMHKFAAKVSAIEDGVYGGWQGAPMSGKLRDGAMIAGMVVAWSVFYAVSKHMVDATGSPFAAGFLLRLGALVFLTVQLVADGQFKALFHQGRAALLLVVIGVFGFLLDLFANLGYAGGTLSTGTALLKTDVLMVNLITVAVYHKKLYASDWLGSLVMLLGVLLVLGLDFRSFAFRPADLFFLLSALCVTVNAFLIKAAQERYGRNTDSISYYNNFTVLVLFAAFALMRGDLQALTPSTIPHFWGLVALGGLAQTCIYFFYYRNLKRHEVWVVKLWLLFMPVVSCLIGVLFLHEVLTAKKVLGIGVVLLGAAVILLRGKLNQKKAEA